VSPSETLFLAFLIGVIDGLRSLTAPAVVAWAAHRNWLPLQKTALAFLGSTPALVIFIVLAIGELIADQLPSTPSRIKPPGLIARIVLGGLCGSAVAAAGGQSMLTGGFLGAIGGGAGAFGGYQVRTRLVRSLHVPDFVIACLEDAVAIGGGLFVVSRF
jgi:uncharacterized membrane protein